MPSGSRIPCTVEPLFGSPPSLKYSNSHSRAPLSLKPSPSDSPCACSSLFHIFLLQVIMRRPAMPGADRAAPDPRITLAVCHPILCCSCFRCSLRSLSSTCAGAAAKTNRMEEDLRSQAGLKGKMGWAGLTREGGREKKRGTGRAKARAGPTRFFSFLFCFFFNL